MTGVTEATVTCVVCGERQTFLGSQWEVTVGAEVWEKAHGRAAHDGEKVPARVDRPRTPQGSARPGGRV